MPANILWQVKNAKEGCREVIVTARKKAIMLPSKYIYLPSKQAPVFKTSSVISDSMDESSIHHWFVQTKEMDFIFHCWVCIKFFMDQALQNLLLRNLTTLMRHLLGSSIPVVTSSWQEVICNSILKEYLIRYIKVNRILRIDLWTKSYLPCLSGCVPIKIWIQRNQSKFIRASRSFVFFPRLSFYL